jgi:hypothetical protein
MALGKTQLTERQQDIATLTLAWEQFFPQFAVPEEFWLRTWLNKAPLGTVLGAFEFLHGEDIRFVKTAEHLSKLVTIALRTVTYASN